MFKPSCNQSAANSVMLASYDALLLNALFCVKKMKPPFQAYCKVSQLCTATQ